PPINEYKWELYNIAEDYSQNDDLAAKMPRKVKDMQNLFMQEAAKYEVFPLDNDILKRILTPRPSATAGRSEFIYTGEMSGIPTGNAPSILTRSFTITADITVPSGGAEGMLVTEGGRFGGYGLYLLKGAPVFTYNFLDMQRTRWEGKEALSPGKHTIVFDFTYDGPGFGKGGSGVLKVDSAVASRQRMEHTVPFILPWDETFDVGVDTRTGVDDSDYQVPFRFTGTINKLTVKLGPPQVMPAAMKTAQDKVEQGRQ